MPPKKKSRVVLPPQTCTSGQISPIATTPDRSNAQVQSHTSEEKATDASGPSLSSITKADRFLTEPVTPDGWTDEQEITLFKAIAIYRWKPAGIHKHFRMLAIEQMMRNHGVSDTHTTPSGIWRKLNTLYNLTIMDEREDMEDDPEGAKWSEFKLPQAEFGKLMAARGTDPKQQKREDESTNHHNEEGEAGSLEEIESAEEDGDDKEDDGDGSDIDTAIDPTVSWSTAISKHSETPARRSSRRGNGVLTTPRRGSAARGARRGGRDRGRGRGRGGRGRGRLRETSENQQKPNSGDGGSKEESEDDSEEDTSVDGDDAADKSFSSEGGENVTSKDGGAPSAPQTRGGGVRGRATSRLVAHHVEIGTVRRSNRNPTK